MKITVRVATKLWTKLTDLAHETGFKRDALFSRVLGNELRELASELNGRTLSEKAKREVNSHLKNLDLTQTSIQLDELVVGQLNEIVRIHNLNRDSVINRVLLFFVASDTFLNALDLEPVVTEDIFRVTEAEIAVPLSPLETIRNVVSDPFYVIRTVLQHAGEKGVYAVALPNQLFGLTCYCNDLELPSNYDELINSL